MEELKPNVVNLPGKWSFLDAIESGWNYFYGRLQGRYLKALNTELYGSRIKNCFNLQFQAKSADKSLLQAYIARDQVAQVIVILTFVILFYITLSYLNILPPYWQKGQPLIMGILTFYVFLVVPLKNTSLMASLRSFFMKDGPFLNVKEDFAVDECMFLSFVALFYVFFYIAKFINRKFQVQEKIEKKLHFSIRPLLDKIYSGTIISFIILYCLNLGLQDGRGVFQLIINLAVFLTLLLYVVIFLFNEETKYQTSDFIKKASSCINKYFFSFLRFCVNTSFYVILIALLMLDIAPYSIICRVIHSCASSVFFYLFTHSLGFYFVLAKICLLGCFVMYCIYNNKKDKLEDLRASKHAEVDTDESDADYVAYVCGYRSSVLGNPTIPGFRSRNPVISPTLEESQEELVERERPSDWNNQSSSSSSYSREGDGETAGDNFAVNRQTAEAADDYFTMDPDNHETSMIKCVSQTGLQVETLEQKSNEEVPDTDLSNASFQQLDASARPYEESFAVPVSSDNSHAFETMQPIQTPEFHLTGTSMPNLLLETSFTRASFDEMTETRNSDPFEGTSFMIFNDQEQVRNNSSENLMRETSEDSTSTVCNSASDNEE